MTPHPAGLWGRLPDKSVKFHDPCLNCSQEITAKDVGGNIFYGFRNYLQLEVVSDIISSVHEEQVGMDVHAKFGDFRSNPSRDI